jgi:hypothetical protein
MGQYLVVVNGMSTGAVPGRTATNNPRCRFLTEFSTFRFSDRRETVDVLMQRMCREYRTVVRMLESRGTPEFSELSWKLCGSAGYA